MFLCSMEMDEIVTLTVRASPSAAKHLLLDSVVSIKNSTARSCGPLGELANVTSNSTRCKENFETVALLYSTTCLLMRWTIFTG